MNVVITKTLESENFIKCTSIEAAIKYVNDEYANAAKWIIGGATLYNRGLKDKFVDEVYLTRVHGDYSKYFASFPQLYNLTRLRYVCRRPLRDS